MKHDLAVHFKPSEVRAAFQPNIFPAHAAVFCSPKHTKDFRKRRMLMKSSKEIIQVLREAKSYFLSTILIQPLNGLTQSLHSYWTRQLPNGITDRILTVYTFFLRNLKQCRLTHLMAGVNPHKMNILLCFVLISSTGKNHRCLSDIYFKNEWNWWLTDRIFAVMFITEFFLKQKKKKIFREKPHKKSILVMKNKTLTAKSINC